MATPALNEATAALRRGSRASTAGASPPAVPRSKRALDLVLASALLVLIAPLLVLAAILIRLDSPGPVLFRQARVGLGGRTFEVLKLRTMVADAEQRRAALLAGSLEREWLKIPVDPRVTRIGRVLRRTSLDELPQLWNVVRGEMSLVGPRPLIAVEHGALAPWAQCRTDVQPGITGPWQVGGRTELAYEEMLRLDCEYARSRTFRGDLALLVRTIPAVLTCRGAN